MGVPRDVINMRSDQNFLFAGQVDTGPGQYNPVKPMGHSPSALFGQDTTKGRVEPQKGSQVNLVDLIKQIKTKTQPQTTTER